MRSITINGHFNFGPGRPKCTLKCCTNPAYILMLYQRGMSTYQIAEEVGSSSTHISHCLHKMGLILKGRGSYRRSKKKKEGRKEELTDQELYLEDMKNVGEKLTE